MPTFTYNKLYSTQRREEEGQTSCHNNNTEGDLEPRNLKKSRLNGREGARVRYATRKLSIITKRIKKQKARERVHINGEVGVVLELLGFLQF